MTIIRTIVLLTLALSAIAFKTEAKKIASGNYDVESTCPKGHTSYRRRGDTNTYSCPYKNCGLDVK